MHLTNRFLFVLLNLTTSAIAAVYPAFEHDEYLAKEYEQCSDARIVPLEFFSHNHDNYESGKCFDSYYNTLNKQNPTPQDWVNVTACVKKNDDHETLMMLYANGFGVKKDINSAILQACFVGGAPAEIKGRLAHLNTLNSNTKISKVKVFDICDDITSGMMMGECAYHEDKQKDKKRIDELSKLTTNWPVNQKEAFANLIKIHRKFAEARSLNEIDLSGSGRAAFQIWEQSSELDSFLMNFKNFEAKKLPDFSEEEYLNLDKKLNDHYKVILHLLDLKKEGNFNQFNKSEVIKTEKLWLNYRDEFVKLGQLRYPDSKAYIWNAASTKHRVIQLKDLRELLTD